MPPDTGGLRGDFAVCRSRMKLRLMSGDGSLSFLLPRDGVMVTRHECCALRATPVLAASRRPRSIRPATFKPSRSLRECMRPHEIDPFRRQIWHRSTTKLPSKTTILASKTIIRWRGARSLRRKLASSIARSLRCSKQRRGAKSRTLITGSDGASRNSCRSLPWLFRRRPRFKRMKSQRGDSLMPRAGNAPRRQGRPAGCRRAQLAQPHFYPAPRRRRKRVEAGSSYAGRRLAY